MEIVILDANKPCSEYSFYLNEQKNYTPVYKNPGILTRSKASRIKKYIEHQLSFCTERHWAYIQKYPLLHRTTRSNSTHSIRGIRYFLLLNMGI